MAGRRSPWADPGHYLCDAPETQAGGALEPSSVRYAVGRWVTLASKSHFICSACFRLIGIRRFLFFSGGSDLRNFTAFVDLICEFKIKYGGVLFGAVIIKTFLVLMGDPP